MLRVIKPFNDHRTIWFKMNVRWGDEMRRVKISCYNYEEFIIVFTCSPCVNLYSSSFLFLCTSFFSRINCHIHFLSHFLSLFLSPLFLFDSCFLSFDLYYSVSYDLETWPWPSRQWASLPKFSRMMIMIRTLKCATVKSKSWNLNNDFSLLKLWILKNELIRNRDLLMISQKILKISRFS